MTFVVVVMVGLGAVLLISGIEDTPFIATFKQVLAGTPITAADTQASASSATAVSSQPTNPLVPGLTPGIS